MKSLIELELDERLMTRDEVAVILRVSPRSLSSVPGLRVVQINKRVLRYRQGDVVDWIRGHGGSGQADK
jgi:hypothetical protein